MKKFPIITPPGSKVVITQGYFYPNVNPETNQTHDAIDFVLYNPALSDIENKRLSYGSQLVCPVPNAKCVQRWDFGTMNDKGDGVDLEWQEGEYWYRLHFWHLMKELVNVGDSVTEGQVVGLMGNTGDVRPLPTPDKPYDGTHCHKRFSQYQKNSDGGNINIVSLDPRLYFDILNPYTGNDSSVVVDLEPIYWAWNKLGITSIFQKLIYMFTNIFK